MRAPGIGAGLAAATETILLTPNQRRVAEDRRDCYWLYVVTNCGSTPELQEPIRDPARFAWHEVVEVRLEVRQDAMTKPIQEREQEMKLITKVRIEGFRSIRDVEIDPLAEFTALAGLNNSGKSNVLRALNAFFNDETDPGQPVDVDTDYFRPDLRKKKRKRILVSATFELPDQFVFRKGLEGVEGLLGKGPFTIAKQWDRDNPQPTFVLDGRTLNLDDQQKATQFLQLIKYRYVPNRVLPTELIRSEHQSLRNVLVRRLGRHSKGDVKAFGAIRDISEQMIKSLSRRFEEACPGQGKVSLAAPTSWNDLAFTVPPWEG